MNRRDALRRIGTGSAVLAGASVVVSQPAFAFSGPNGATAATLMAVRRNNQRVDMTVPSLGTTQCSGSSIGSSQEFVDVTATEFALTGNAFLQLTPFDGSGGPALPETTDQSTFSVRRVGSGCGGVNANRLQVNDAFDIALRICHTCTYTGPGTGSAIFTTVYRVTWDGTNPQTALISSP